MTRNKQIRAVLLAALMVFSVFAGSIALSGSAAAEVTSVNTTEVTEGDTADISVNVDSVDNTGSGGAAENNTTVWIDANGNGELDAGELNATNTTYNPTYDGNTEEVIVEGLDISSLEPGTYNLSAAETAGFTQGMTAEVNTTIDITAAEPTDAEGSPELNSATHYEDASGQPVLELSFSEAIDSGTYENITVYRDDEDVTTDVVAGTPTQDVDGQVIVPTNDVYTGDLEVNLEGVTDTAGNSVDEGLDSDNNASITVATVTADGNSPNAYQGEVVAITNGDVDQDVEIESDDSQDDNEGYSFLGSTGTTSEVFVFDTSDRELETYNYSVGTDEGQIEVRDLGLDVAVDDLNVTTDEDLEGTVSANAGGRTVDITLLDEDGDEVDDEDYTPVEGAELDGQGELDFSFDISDLSEGDYTVEVTDTQSGVSVESDTVAVSEAAEGEVDFETNVVTDQRGDVVAIPLDLSNTDIATVSIGSEDQGYAANVTVEDGDDDGEVILLWDSSQSTSTNVNDVFDVEDSDDDILTGSNDDTEITTATGDLIDAGDYDLEVRTGSTATDDNADNVGTLVLEEGSIETVQTWTAPNSESFSDLEDVTEALENGNVTQDDQIAFGDKVVVQIVASGLEGQTGAQGDETPNFFGDSYGDSYQLVINQTNPGPNRDARTLNVSSADVVADGDNDTYFVVFNSENIDAQRETNDEGTWDEGVGAESDAAPEDDDAYQVEFKMIGEDDVDTANALVEDNVSETAEYEHVEAEHTFDADPVNVSNAEEQTISGTSNVAPGSELTIRLRSDGDTQPRFLKTATAYVSENGTFSADFDFSEQSVGDTFTATASGGVADDAEVDGNVVEAVEETTTSPEETTTETTTEQPTTEQPTTEQPTTEQPTTEQPTEETTDAGTPGFGIAVALVALVAAALLAIRRD